MCAEEPNEPMSNASPEGAMEVVSHPPYNADSPGHNSTVSSSLRLGKKQADSTSPSTPSMNTRSKRFANLASFVAAIVYVLFSYSQSHSQSVPQRPPHLSH